MRLVLATRRSPLALAQSRAFARALEARVPGLAVEELQLVTAGDRTQDKPLVDIGGKGLFVKELEEALLDGRASFAVHSIKDVPAALAPGLVIACIPAREDPRDAWIARNRQGLKDLPAGSRVGTTSLRRAVAIREARPDLETAPLRGNVDTRLRKLGAGEIDAIVLAMAGLRRLGWADRATEILSPEVSLPAVGQGALGIECREDDATTRAVLAHLADAETTTCVAAERAVMLAVDGSCRLPVAAHAVREGDTLYLRAMLADPDGSRVRRAERRVPFPASTADAEALGQELGAELRGR